MLNEELPTYLRDNKEQLAQVALSQAAIQDGLAKYGISNELVGEAVKVGAEVVSSALPVITELLQSTLQDQHSLMQIIDDTKALVTNNYDRNSIDKLVGSIIDLKNNNPAINKALTEDLPTILSKHSEDIGKVVDGLLNNTKIGQQLKLDTKKVVDVVAEKLPELIKVAEAYNNGKYGEMIASGAKILFDKKVLGLAVGAAGNYIKQKFSGKKDQTKAEFLKEQATGIGKEVKEKLSAKAAAPTETKRNPIHTTQDTVGRG